MGIWGETTLLIGVNSYDPIYNWFVCTHLEYTQNPSSSTINGPPFFVEKAWTSKPLDSSKGWSWKHSRVY